jgi:ClpP class serine protease
MSSGKGRRQRKTQPKIPPAKSQGKPKSLYDAVQEGKEYESLITANIKNADVIVDIRRAAADIQKIRSRPLLIYAGNTVNSNVGARAAITTDDDLPFIELIHNVPNGHDAIDILLVTPGGMAHQVAQFVDTTRKRFSDVTFILPHVAMSAGTIWILSGNDIFMDERALIGPIDPQVISKSGQLVPLQSLQVLIKEIQSRGAKALAAKKQPDWTDILILQNMDAKEVGNSISASNYSIQLASTYLKDHKFRDWIKHSNGSPVTMNIKKIVHAR